VSAAPADRPASLLADNRRMLGKLLVVTAVMFGFGWALVPIYRAVCDALGVNVLSLSELRRTAGLGERSANTEGKGPNKGKGRAVTG